MSEEEIHQENYESSKYEDIESFEDLEINENIIRGIFAYGFETPSPIQKKAILPILDGKDVIAQAQSGTGKTATFCLGVLGLIEPSKNEIQALVLAHTRELALQIHMVFSQIANYMDILFNLSIGGINVKDNIDNLSKKPRKPHVVIGTAGRVLDMINKRALSTTNLKIMIIDEADEMLSEGFVDQIYKIFRFMPASIQVGLFSATMTETFFDISNKFMRKPIKILVKNEQLTLEGIKQYLINVEVNEYKFETLCDLYSLLTINQSIIYCNNKKVVNHLTERMREANFSISFIHSDITNKEREETMSAFRNRKTRVLISTDLLSRGIDVQQISVVINYDVPYDIQNYLHRIGRSGRFGRKGVAINFMTKYDTKKITDIEAYYNTHIEEMPENIQSIFT